MYKTIILPVVLYGCETWFLTLREEHKLRVSENRVLRNIFGSKREEVAGYWRRLHSEELRNLYSSQYIIRVIISRRISWTGNVARMGDIKNAYKSLGGETEGKRPLGKPNRRWEDSITVDLKETVWEVVDWIHLIQDRDQW
jgi:hypothetical protein